MCKNKAFLLPTLCACISCSGALLAVQGSKLTAKSLEVLWISPLNSRPAVTDIYKTELSLSQKKFSKRTDTWIFSASVPIGSIILTNNRSNYTRIFEAGPTIIELLKLIILFDSFVLSKLSGSRSKMVHVTWFFGWYPYPDKH